jgi:hypothetical protein
MPQFVAISCDAIVLIKIKDSVIARKAPYAVALQEGESDSWCARGGSNSQPFGDC